MVNKFAKGPVVSKILHESGSSASAESMAARLTLRLGQPVFLCAALPAGDSDLQSFVERTIVAEVTKKEAAGDAAA